MEKEILKLENVSYRYADEVSDYYALKDINYTFELGKVYAIRGKSGSGKTTLLSLISGLETNYEGAITYDGKDLKKMDLDKYRNTCIGIVFQSYNLLPHLTASENIILSMDINGMKIKNKREKALELMKSVGLSDTFASRKILKLSGGEQQRIAIARSLSYDPDVIIADEPTGALDYNTGKMVLKLLQDTCRKEGMTVVLITHNLAIAPMADRVIKMKNSKVISNIINESIVSVDEIEW